MRAQHKRGSNNLSFIFTEKLLSKMAEKVRSFRGRIIQTLNYRDKVINVMTGRKTASRNPQSIWLKYTIQYTQKDIRKYKRETGLKLGKFYYLAEPMVQDYYVTPVTLMNMVADNILTFDQKYKHYIEGLKAKFKGGEAYELPQNYRLKGVTISYIYYPKENG